MILEACCIQEPWRSRRFSKDPSFHTCCQEIIQFSSFCEPSSLREFRALVSHRYFLCTLLIILEVCLIQEIRSLHLMKIKLSSHNLRNFRVSRSSTIWERRSNFEAGRRIGSQVFEILTNSLVGWNIKIEDKVLEWVKNHLLYLRS